MDPAPIDGSRPHRGYRRRKLSRLELVAVVVAVLVYLSSIIDAVVYRNWTQLVSYIGQGVAILLLLAFLHHRTRRATREGRRPADR